MRLGGRTLHARDETEFSDWPNRHLFPLALIVVLAGEATYYGVTLRSELYWSYILSGVLGGLVATAELVSRYRDAPAAAVLSLPAFAYVLVNWAAADLALYIMGVFQWTFGAVPPHARVIQVLAAGLGSTALFRSSLFNVTAGEQVVNIGPNAILHVILSAADRAVDRQRALIRVYHARRIMAGISFESSAQALFAYSVATLQNISLEETNTVENRISVLRGKDHIPDQLKAQVLGMSLLTLVGAKVLKEAAGQIRLLDEKRDVPEARASSSGSNDQSAEQIVMTAIGAHGGTMQLAELRAVARLPLSAFTEVLVTLMAKQVVTIRGRPGEEVIAIA